MKIGERIRKAREKSGMTQFQLARKLGFGSSQFVSLFERGLSKVPNDVLGKLVVILGLPEKKLIKQIVAEYNENLVDEIHRGKLAQLYSGDHEGLL